MLAACSHGMYKLRGVKLYGAETACIQFFYVGMESAACILILGQFNRIRMGTMEKVNHRDRSIYIGGHVNCMAAKMARHRLLHTGPRSTD